MHPAATQRLTTTLFRDMLHSAYRRCAGADIWKGQVVDEMKIFIGWSGELSRAMGSHLRDWIPDVIRNAEPWLSSEDLQKGAQWLPELNKNLANSTVGIMVLTRENLAASWIVFEAGALSKALPNEHCCTLLCDLKPTDVSGPLAQFQATSLDAEDMLRLMKTINVASGDAKIDDSRLKRWFDQFWPLFEKRCQEELSRASTEKGEPAPGPTERDLLEEILGTVRRMTRGYSDALTIPAESVLDELIHFRPKASIGLSYEELVDIRRRLTKAKADEDKPQDSS